MPNEEQPKKEYKTKFGPSQFENPAPLWYRKMTNAIIIGFLPVYVGFVDIIRMSDYERTIYTHIGVAIPFLLKAIGALLGNGQIYFPSNNYVESLNKKNDIKNLLMFWFVSFFLLGIYSLLN